MVSILVLVDDVLEEENADQKIVSHVVSILVLVDDVLEGIMGIYLPEKLRVSILVLVDDVLEANPIIKPDPTGDCFNPCFGG